MDKIQKGVKDFMQEAGQDCPEKPTVPPFKDRTLRVKLTLEELLEFAKGSGVNVCLDLGGNTYSLEDWKEHLVFEDTKEVDLQEVVDGIADISYVNYGAALTWGIDMEPIEKIVQEANMAKFGEGGYRREDGKWMKPPDWEDPAPKIKAEIERQLDRKTVE